MPCMGPNQVEQAIWNVGCFVPWVKLIKRNTFLKCHHPRLFSRQHLHYVIETLPTSWKRRDISQTRHILGSSWNWHTWRSARKKSRRRGVWVNAWTIQFMKQVLPRLIRPRSPWKMKNFVYINEDNQNRNPRSLEHLNELQMLTYCRVFGNPLPLWVFFEQFYFVTRRFPWMVIFFHAYAIKEIKISHTNAIEGWQKLISIWA